jgi:predicted ATPase/DNA-binding CsgD family transcriptional regulator
MGATAFPDPPAGGAAPGWNSPFIGREDELRLLEERLDSHRLVTLTGIGGAGKTRLAHEVRSRLSPRFADGSVTADLAIATSSAHVVALVARAAGVFDSSAELSGADASESQLIGALGDRSLLLVLDNCEHVIDTCAALVLGVGSGCPHVRVLVTSRVPLGVTGEQRIVVGPLTEDAACELFHARARSVGVELDRAADDPLVRSICARVDHLALAVELAAARSRMMPLASIDERLDAALGLLASHERAPDPRQATMTAALDWSYGLLDAVEQAVFRRLGVFVGGWTLAAADDVCREACGSEGTVEVLGRLVDKSLVSFSLDSDRYRLLEPVRQYAWQRLIAAGEEAELVDLHRRHYRREARSVNARILSSGLTAADQADLANFRTAVDRALRDGDGRAALAAFASLGWFWVTTGSWRDAVESGQAALDLATDCEPRIELVGQSMVAGFLAYSGRPLLAIPHLERALQLLWAAPADHGSRYLLSTALECTGRSPVEMLEEAEAAAIAGGDPPFAGYIARAQARYHLLMWDLDAAMPPLLRAIAHLVGANPDFADQVQVQHLALDAARGIAPPAHELIAVERDRPSERQLPFYGEDRALLLAVAGDPARAAAAIGAECHRSARGGWMQRTVLQLHEAALARSRLGQATHALTLAASARATARRLGYPAFPILDHLGAAELEASAHGLGASATARATARGEHLAVSEAVALAASPVPAPGAGPLSSREAELMSLVGAGLENREIAAQLYISGRTVDAHLSHIRTKLGISSRAALVRWAIDHGLTEVPPATT